MKIDFEQKILQLSGEEMRTEKGEAFTLRNACVVSLDAMTEEMKRLSADEKYIRGQLAARIYRTKEPINLKAEEISILKDVIGKIYGPHIVHEAWDLLDPTEESGDETKEITPTIPDGTK
jgi:hypothetical protein